MNSTVENKKRIVRDIFERGWNLEEFATFSGAVANPVILNFRGEQQATNLEGLKELVAFWRRAFPNLTFHVVDLIGDRDLVAANLVFTGTHLGPWQGLQPTGQEIRVEEMMFFRFDKGKLVEMWEVFDEVAMNTQLRLGPENEGSAAE